MPKLKIGNVLVLVGWVLTILSLIVLYRQGVSRSFFHQDDVVELGVVADWKGITTLLHLNNEHLNITFWPLLYLQWLLFGISYTPYLTLNVILHTVILGVVFLITHKITKSFFWSSLPVWGMVINSNWFTVVWWITGQMFFLATFFALMTYLVILKTIEKPKSWSNYFYIYLFSLLPGLSWGVGLTWPMWPMLVFGVDYIEKKLNRIGMVLMLSQISLTALYFSIIGNNLYIHTNPKTWLTNPFGIINFMIVGISNTIVGRWLWPPENLKVRVVFLFLALVVIILAKKYWRLANKQVFFGFLIVAGSYLTFAIPRWRFGIGHAMANYYAYFPLPFLLISTSVFLSKIRMGQITKIFILAVFLIHIPLSWMGFEEWARDWVKRPQETREYFRKLDSVKSGACLENVFIPEYIVPQNIWRIDYMWPIFKKDFDPFCKE